jgi:hypothetical protein
MRSQGPNQFTIFLHPIQAVVKLTTLKTSFQNFLIEDRYQAAGA